MITWGFVPSYSDAAVNNVAFTQNGRTFIAAYIFVGGASGDIVWENNQGEAQWFPGSLLGQSYILGAQRILSSGTVNSIPRLTTATGIIWFAINQLTNAP
jgi:hypothetical protein